MYVKEIGPGIFQHHLQEVHVYVRWEAIAVV